MSSRTIAASWLATRIAMGRSSAGLARGRARLWRRLQPALRHTPALASFAGRPLADFPITEIASLRADYGRWNSLGVSHDQLHAAALDAERGGSGEVAQGVVAGYSTGGRGVRGLFVASAEERADYIGQILARAVPVTALLKPMRLALMLRANSSLYSDSASARRAFLHLSLDLPPAEAAAALARFSPTVLIAPAHRLVQLADEGTALPALIRLFYGAEPMSAAERAFVADVLGVRPDPIYQATEGFLGAACPRGALHLNDHSLEVELEPVAGTEGYRPIVTDLRRVSQPIVRVRTDDYLELDPDGCSCGYAGRVIRPVMGRATEIWRWPGRVVTPNQISAAMDALLPPPAQWQAIAAANHLELRLDRSIPRRDAIADGLREALDLPVPVILGETPPELPAPKRVRLRGAGAAHD